MSAGGMRTRRTGAPRVPGFPDPPTPAPALPLGSYAISAPAPEPGAVPTVERLDPTAGTRQLNVRVLAPLMLRYKRLLRDLADDGFQTNLTEFVHALLHQGPRDPAEVRAAVRAWRQALDPGE